MRLKEFRLDEMPVRDITHIGNWERAHGFTNPMDRRAMNSPKIMDKVRKKLAGSDYDFVFYMVNSPGARRAAFRGMTDIDKLHQGYAGLPPKVALQIQQDSSTGKLEDAVTVVYVDNSGADRFVVTPWIIVHRMWHAISPRVGAVNHVDKFAHEIEEGFLRVTERILQTVYGFGNMNSLYFYRPGDAGFLPQKRILEALGTTRACREGMLSFPTEFFPEIFAQYLTRGEVRFNPLPAGIKIGRGTSRANPELLEDANEELQTYARDFKYYFDDLLNQCANRVFIV